MKLPAIQFYPGDWHKDQGIQALNLEERGAWWELLLMMHDSDERGVLLVNGFPMPEAVIARRLGLDNQKFNQILTTLLTYGVASRRESDNAIFCRRMVKDENLRKIRTEAGKKGGNPNLVKQKPNQKTTSGDKQNSTPTITTSTSISTSISNTKNSPTAEFLKEETPAVEEISEYEILESYSGSNFQPDRKKNFHTGGAAAQTTDKRQFVAEFPTLESFIQRFVDQGSEWISKNLNFEFYFIRLKNYSAGGRERNDWFEYACGWFREDELRGKLIQANAAVKKGQVEKNLESKERILEMLRKNRNQ